VKIQAAVLDFSGTTCDAHVIAPAYSFVKAFEEFKVPITMEEARKPMGLRKDMHI
jgi:phosphonoacetaldehyde hydrolase